MYTGEIREIIKKSLELMLGPNIQVKATAQNTLSIKDEEKDEEYKIVITKVK